MPKPVENNIAFYLLTNKGIYSNHENISKIEDRSSSLLPLFEEANIVLGELRSVSKN